MFIHAARSTNTARIFSIVVGIALLLSGAVFLLFTMHIYPKRTPPKLPGLRGPKSLRTENDGPETGPSSSS